MSVSWPVPWSFESSTPGTLPSIHCRTVNMQPSMQCKDLAVTPSILQKHVGSLAEVSICHMWLNSVYALCEQPFPWPAPPCKPLLLSACACKLSRLRRTQLIQKLTVSISMCGSKLLPHALRAGAGVAIASCSAACTCGRAVLSGQALAGLGKSLDQHAAESW